MVLADYYVYIYPFMFTIVAALIVYNFDNVSDILLALCLFILGIIHGSIMQKKKEVEKNGCSARIE